MIINVSLMYVHTLHTVHHSKILVINSDESVPFRKGHIDILVYSYLHVYWYSICQHKVNLQYSNYSVVSFPHYSSSTVVLTVIAVHVN